MEIFYCCQPVRDGCPLETGMAHLRWGWVEGWGLLIEEFGLPFFSVGSGRWLKDSASREKDPWIPALYFWKALSELGVFIIESSSGGGESVAVCDLKDKLLIWSFSTNTHPVLLLNLVFEVSVRILNCLSSSSPSPLFWNDLEIRCFVSPNH